MKKFVLAAAVLACACVGRAQMGRTTDWWTYGGDAQRTGWEKNDQKFTKDDVKNFQLLWKMKLDNKQKGTHALLPPVILGNLIGYRGFKELAFVAGSSDELWAIDADLDRLYWQKRVGAEGGSRSVKASVTCSGGLTAMPSLPAPITFRLSAPTRERTQAAAKSASGSGPAGGGTNPDGTPRPGGANPGAAAGKTTARPAASGESASEAAMRKFFAPKPVYVLASDGKLHQLNQQDGAEVGTPLPFVPAGAKAQSLNISDSVLYTTTSRGCKDTPDAVWALDLSDSEMKVASFMLDGTAAEGLGGTAIGTDGTVYVQTGDGRFDPAASKYGNTLLALSAKDLKVQQYFTMTGENAVSKSPDMNATTPVVFSYKGREVVVTAGRDGRLYGLDAKTLGGKDHKTPLFRTEPVSAENGESAGHGLWGSLSSWEDTDGTRYVLATVWGPVNSDLKMPGSNGDAPNGSVVAFKMQERNGKPALTPAWISHNLLSPAPPVIAKGVVFALSNGEFKRKLKQTKGMMRVEERPQGSAHAVLYALDGTTGKELYSTGDQVDAPGSLTGLSIANSRLYFTTTDNTIYAFGKYLEH